MSVARYLQTSAIAASILMYVLPAFGFEAKPFDASAFEAAQAAGKACPSRNYRPVVPYLRGAKADPGEAGW
jgi:hypothetical protein